MATAFQPGLGSLSAYALGRCGVRRSAIEVYHLEDVAFAANLVLSDWSLDEPMLWSVEQRSFLLGQGTTTYILPHDVLTVLDCFLRTNPGTSYLMDAFGQPVLDGNGDPIVTTQGVPAANQDRILYAASRSEYASYPNKDKQSPPTVFWADRVVPIQIRLYPAPDGQRQYLFNYFCVVQQQDQALAGDLPTGSPYRMFSVFADAIAAKLALSYAPDKFELLDKVAERSYARARAQEHENVSIYIQPDIRRYYGYR